MRILYDGEKRYVGVTITRTDEEEFTIETAQYEICDTKGNTIVAKTDAINDDPDVMMLFDTTLEAIETCNRYWVFFYIGITDSDEIIMVKVEVDVTR